ncbi:MAG TPA: signal peptidase II [Pseudogracilibacillus sp.]|nr:signal peptidase II [Pseudogracilibacillus sp.]
MWRYYGLAVFLIALDQWTKFVVIKKMELYESIPVLDGFFSFTSHRNKGAAWGVLQDQMIFFYIITVIVVVAIVFYMQTHAKGRTLFAVGLAFILGGAIGNFIDRLIHQEVVDFIDVIIFTYDFPIFNIADSALTIGVILALIATFWEEHTNKKGKENL